MNAKLNRKDVYLELVKEFPLIPIRTKVEYKSALGVIRKLTSDPSLLVSDRLDYVSVLGSLIADYEAKHLPAVPKLPARKLLAFIMEQNGLSLTALAEEIGGHKSNLSAFLSGNRSLSKEHALALARRFNLDVSIFLKDE